MAVKRGHVGHDSQVYHGVKNTDNVGDGGHGGILRHDAVKNG